MKLNYIAVCDLIAYSVFNSCMMLNQRALVNRECNVCGCNFYSSLSFSLRCLTVITTKEGFHHRSEMLSSQPQIHWFRLNKDQPVNFILRPQGDSKRILLLLELRGVGHQVHPMYLNHQGCRRNKESTRKISISIF